MYNPFTTTLLNDLLEKVDRKGENDIYFDQRLALNFESICQYLKVLYPGKDHASFLSELLQLLFNQFNERKIGLKQLDIDRTRTPHWFLNEKWVGMMLYTDHFVKNLKEFPEKIDYFKDLGVNLVHLMPLMECPPENNDGGYAVSNFRKVSPNLGSMKDIEKLTDIFHENEMIMMLDLAINHTSDEHEWALKAKKGDKSYQDYFYFFDNREIPNQFEATMPQVFPDTAPGNFTHIAEINKWVMSVFHHYQWDLNYSNPKVFLEMLDVLLYLLNKGIDIIRLDALAFTWKKLGTDCQNLNEAHTLIKLFKACAQIVAPGTLFLAEAIVAPEKIVKYFGESNGISNECDIAYNASLMTLAWEMIATKNTRLFKVSMDNIPSKPIGTTWLNYIRCHDDIGLGYEDQHAAWAGYEPHSHRHFITDFLTGHQNWSFASGQPFMRDPVTGYARVSGSLASLAGLEKAINANDASAIDQSLKRIILLHAIIMAFGGIPHLYMGDEIGLLNDYSYQNDKGKKHDNRWIHRPIMDWSKAAKRNKEGTVEYKIYQKLKKLIAVRKKEPLFADQNNVYLPETHNQHILLVERYSQGSDRVCCAFNLNDQPEPLYGDVLNAQGIDPTSMIDISTGEMIPALHSNVMMNPYQFLWLKNN